MAFSDLMYPLFLIPMWIHGLYKDSWMIGGPLGQASCKLVSFLTLACGLVSILNLVLIAVDRCGAVLFPLRSPPISSKLCPFFILTTWIIAMVVGSPYLFAMKLVKYPPDWNVRCIGTKSLERPYLLNRLWIQKKLYPRVHVHRNKKLHFKRAGGLGRQEGGN